MSVPVPSPEDIPADLRERDNWVCWRTEIRDEDGMIRLDPDPVSSSLEHAAARQLRKHLRGVSS